MKADAAVKHERRSRRRRRSREAAQAEAAAAAIKDRSPQARQGRWQGRGRVEACEGARKTPPRRLGAGGGEEPAAEAAETGAGAASPAERRRRRPRRPSQGSHQRRAGPPPGRQEGPRRAAARPPSEAVDREYAHVPRRSRRARRPPGCLTPPGRRGSQHVLVRTGYYEVMRCGANRPDNPGTRTDRRRRPAARPTRSGAPARPTPRARRGGARRRILGAGRRCSAATPAWRWGWRTGCCPTTTRSTTSVRDRFVSAHGPLWRACWDNPQAFRGLARIDRRARGGQARLRRRRLLARAPGCARAGDRSRRDRGAIGARATWRVELRRVYCDRRASCRRRRASRWCCGGWTGWRCPKSRVGWEFRLLTAGWSSGGTDTLARATHVPCDGPWCHRHGALFDRRPHHVDPQNRAWSTPCEGRISRPP